MVYNIPCRIDKKPKGTRVSKRETMKKNCPFSIYISTAKDDMGFWSIKRFNCTWYHNHIPSSDPAIYHELRKPSGSQQLLMSSLIEAKNTPSQVVDFMHKLLKINARDVSNFTAKYFSTSSVDGELQELVDEMESLGFIIRLELQQPGNKVLKSIFLTHPKCIEQAAVFPEVVILDSTYKTNACKMPLVNIVGVSNLGSEYKNSSVRTFSIAVAAISDEKKPTYEWVIKTLLETVWGDCSSYPMLFVSDDDPSLGLALEKHAPDTPHVLCAWHIEKNFMAKLGKTFGANTKEYGDYQAAVKAMIWSRDEDGFDGGLKAFMDLIKGTDKEGDLVSYVNRYVLDT